MPGSPLTGVLMFLCRKVVDPAGHNNEAYYMLMPNHTALYYTPGAPSTFQLDCPLTRDFCAWFSLLMLSPADFQDLRSFMQKPGGYDRFVTNSQPSTRFL